jgi:UDP-glucose 4-epimerase
MESRTLKKCLITGASGLIGSHLLTALHGEWELLTASRRRPVAPPGVAVAWYPVDLAAEWDPRELPQWIDAVVYLAQSERFREFPEAAEDVFRVNTLSALRLLEYARTAGARSFVFASSGGVYGSGAGDLSEDLEISAKDDLGFYLSTKVCAEILAANYVPFMNVQLLRFFFVYGPGQRRSMLIPRLVESVQEGRPIVLQGRDGIRINPTYVSDAVAAVGSSLQLEGSHKINVAGPDALTMREVGDTIGRVVGRDPVFDVQEGAEPKHIVGNVARMTELVGAPKVSLERGIEMLLSAPVAY